MTIDSLGSNVGAETRQAAREWVDLDLALDAVTSHRRPKPVRAVVAVAFAVLVVIGGVVGAELLGAAERPGTEEPIPAASTAGPTPTPSGSDDGPKGPNYYYDVEFVDVDTGRSTDLPRSISRIEAAQFFDVSPDGAHLTFYGDGRIFVAQVDGTQVRPVCPAPEFTSPRWSPDGDRIVFTAGHELRVVDLSTGVVQRIQVGNAPVYAPDFSADGQTILFTMNHRDAFALWTVPVAGGDPQLLLERAAFGTYSPDGTTIAFRRTLFGSGPFTEMTNASVWLTDTAGSRPRRVDQGGGSMSQFSARVLWPSWSPDGSRIAYQRWYKQDIVVVEVDSGRTVALLPVQLEDKTVTWLDDETLIVGTFPDTLA